MKITANQVTIARMLLLPIPCGLVLHGTGWSMLAALCVGAVLGFTDALDGWMARRDGPTVLGGLLDPVADKIFVAAFLLPLAAAGFTYSWVAGGIFLRELLVSGLRSSMAERDEKLRTSRLAKIKTIAQMGGLGVFYFVAFVDEQAMRWVNVGGAGLFLVLFVVFGLKKRGWPAFWITGTLPLWTMIAVVSWVFGRDVTINVIFVTMLALTWASGLDYVVGAWRVLRRSGWQQVDAARVFVSITYAGVVTVVLMYAGVLVVPVLVALSGVLLLFGIDNLVAAEKKRPTKGRFWVGAAGALGLSFLVATPAALSVALPPWVYWAVAVGLAVAQTAIALRGFVADKDLFVEESA